MSDSPRTPDPALRAELRLLQRQLRERTRHARLSTAVGAAFAAPHALPTQLQQCAEALVTHFDAAFARIWILDQDEPDLLVLGASAGRYTHLDGAHGRIRVGDKKIGRIAASRRPHLTNAVIGDPHIPEQAWAMREGLVAFAGYPLTIGPRLLGVLGLFVRHPLEETALEALESVADIVALGIDRSNTEAAHERLFVREQAAREQAEATAATLATLNRVGAMLAAELDLDKAVQAVTDAATDLTRAHFGAFFFNRTDASGESYALYALSGVPRAAFAGLPMPGNTALFGPTVRGENVVRLADVAKDPRFGRQAPTHGLPAGHPPVVSYLAAPVVSRSGEVLGGLFFGHPAPNVFDERAEELVLGLAAYAAVIIDNARLYRVAQASERRYRSLFAGVGDAILVADAERRYLDANPAAVRLLGYALDELIGMRVDEIVVAAPSWTADEFRRFRIEGKWQGELEVRRKDGTSVAVEARATVVDLPEGALHLSALRDISERRALQDQQRQILEAISHDLKNPLAVVRAQTQLLQRQARRAPLAAEALATRLAMIEDASRRIERQLDELQDIARLDAGQPLELRVEAMDLVEAARAAARDAGAASERHHIQLSARDQSLVGTWDPLRLRRVLDNIVGNAVKYSPDGGAITICAAREERADGAWAVIAVTDDGVGIPASDLAHVFERYRRGANVRRRTKGSGIGLAGARQIVEQHGGALSVSSVEGQGSVFTLALPLPPSPTPPASGDGSD